jgi:hypothetical protein
MRDSRASGPNESLGSYRMQPDTSLSEERSIDSAEPQFGGTAICSQNYVTHEA